MLRMVICCVLGAVESVVVGGAPVASQIEAFAVDYGP
jgi:hypothetical protein